MAESRTAVAAALAGNAALALLKGFAAAATGSAAMLAETFHSIADTGNQILLFLGLRLADRPPDDRHPFGHGKNVYFWAFVVSVMLFSLGGAFSIWEAVHKLRHPASQDISFAWAYGVLGGSALFESGSFAIAIRTLWETKGERGFMEYWRDTRDPTLLTVLFEDTAALVSLVIAGAGIWLSSTTGQPAWDAIASALIGTILVGVAVVLALENYSLLIGESSPPALRENIRRAVVADDAVATLASLQTMHLGPRAVLVVLGVVFRREMSVAGIESAVARLHQRVRDALAGRTDARLVVVEPRPPRAADAARDDVRRVAR